LGYEPCAADGTETVMTFLSIACLLLAASPPKGPLADLPNELTPRKNLNASYDPELNVHFFPPPATAKSTA
jgi:hypothetical protein